MDYNEVQSRESISSTIVDEAYGAGSSIEPSEFINHGLLLWNQERQKWKEVKKVRKRAKRLKVPKLRSLCLCVGKKFGARSYATYESLLQSNKPFPRPVPLGEMVSFLVDMWEPGGGYD